MGKVSEVSARQTARGSGRTAKSKIKKWGQRLGALPAPQHTSRTPCAGRASLPRLKISRGAFPAGLLPRQRLLLAGGALDALVDARLVVVRARQTRRALLAKLVARL